MARKLGMGRRSAGKSHYLSRLRQRRGEKRRDARAGSVKTVDVASNSESGNWFGIGTNTLHLLEIDDATARLMDGSGDLGWYVQDARQDAT